MRLFKAFYSLTSKHYMTMLYMGGGKFNIVLKNMSMVEIYYPDSVIRKDSLSWSVSLSKHQASGRQLLQPTKLERAETKQQQQENQGKKSRIEEEGERKKRSKGKTKLEA